MHPLDHPWQDGTFADPVPGADALTQHERIAYVLGRAKEKRLKASGKVVHRPVPAPLRSRGVEKPVEGPSPPCEASGSSGGMEAASAGACEKGEDVSHLLSLEPPLVLRREQLCANFRKGVRGGEDGGSEGENQDLEEETRPRKPAAKALAKASAKAKAKTDKPKPKSHKETKRGKTAAQKTASKAKGAEGDDGGNGKQKRGAPQTWARRYFPKDASDLVKFQAIKDTFEGQIRPHIRRQSSFQDRVKKLQLHFCKAPSLVCALFTMWWPYGFWLQDPFYQLCQKAFVQTPPADGSYEQCCEIVQSLVDGFLNREDVRPYPSIRTLFFYFLVCPRLVRVILKAQRCQADFCLGPSLI